MLALFSDSYPTQASGGGGGGYQSRRANPYAQQDGAYEMTDVKDIPAASGDEMSSFYAEVGFCFTVAFLGNGIQFCLFF